MPLRPIDIILIQPEKRFYVIYNNGKLYRLTRMKLDAVSWKRRTLYTGTNEEIFVAKNQVIEDPSVNKILKTYELPLSLQSRNLTYFLSWWNTNGYEYLKSSTPISASNEPTVIKTEDSNNTTKSSSIDIDSKKVEPTIQKPQEPIPTEDLSNKTNTPLTSDKKQDKPAQKPAAITSKRKDNTSVMKKTSNPLIQKAIDDTNNPAITPTSIVSIEYDTDDIFDALLDDLNSELDDD